MDGDTAQGADVQPKLHLTDRRGVALFFPVGDNEIEDLLLPVGQSFGHHGFPMRFFAFFSSINVARAK